VKKIALGGGNVEDVSIAPVLRQTCTCVSPCEAEVIGSSTCSVLHWGYQLTEADYRAYL